MNDSSVNSPGQAAPDESADESAEARGRLERTAQQPVPGLVAEFVAFLRANKKWWLLPILIVLLLMGLLIALTGTAAAPFIYPLF